jgi:hypothetical protein
MQSWHGNERNVHYKSRDHHQHIKNPWAPAIIRAD